MSNTNNSDGFGTGACEDVYAISDETDRPCPQTPDMKKNNDNTLSDLEQAIVKKNVHCLVRKKNRSLVYLHAKKSAKKFT